MAIELSIEDERWQALGLEALAAPVLAAALRHCGLDPDRCEISLLACDDARIALLNADFRGKPAPTNVLSWPAADLAPEQPGAAPAPPRPDFTGEIALGDIAIAYETCLAEARAAGKPVADHVAHLLVHGCLHLLGYDHVRDADATVMEAIETEILGTMGIDDPYRGHDGL